MKEIPFLPEFEKQIALGIKTATTRSKKYGIPGDRLKAFNMTIELTAVHHIPLSEIAECFYKQEGFNTMVGFIDIWCKIHPRKGFTPTEKKYLHIFRRIE